MGEVRRGFGRSKGLGAVSTPEAARVIAKLPPKIKTLVRSSIDKLLKSPHAGSELVGELDGYRSFKARRYRIIYRFNEPEAFIEIHHVGHRRDVYETLRSLLTLTRHQ